MTVKMRRLTVDEFHAEMKAQGVKHSDDCAFVCPACGTVQSTRDFVAEGLNPDLARIYLGFSCVGRARQRAKPASEAELGQGCDWTLGGLLRIHTLELIRGDGSLQPHFEIATPEQAQALADWHAKAAAEASHA